MKKAEKEQRENEALSCLDIRPGDVVYTTIRSVSRSGMQRTVDLYIVRNNKLEWISGRVAEILGLRRSRDGAVVIGGCGFDVGFEIVHRLSYKLHGMDDVAVMDAAYRAGYSLRHERF